MDRPTCVLFGAILCCMCIMIACGGGGSTSNPAPASNPVPTVTALSPSSLTAGTADTIVTISGTGFISSSAAAWNGTALATTFVGATQLKATLPAADLAGSSIAQISVQNPAPGGGTSGMTTFTVNSPAPAISAVTPRYVPPGAPATVTVTGTGFEANSAVMWNGAAKPTTFVNSTTLTVALSAADLQNQGTGSLTVSNPGPGASTSGTSPLTVTSQPIPVIQSVSVTNLPGGSTGCSGLQVNVTGQNFAYDSTIQANGITLPTILSGTNPTTLVNTLPAGFTSAPGGLTFTVTNPDGGPITSNPYSYPATLPPVLVLCATPSPTTVFAGSSFSMHVQPSEVNVGGNANLVLGTLPSGITTASGTVALPATGLTLHLSAAKTTTPGTYDLQLSGATGTASATADFNFTVSAGAPPNFFFASPIHNEVGVPIGGSGSIQFQSIVNSSGSVDYDVTPSVSGLPTGTTAAFTPSVFAVGESVTVTLSAASTAPVTQNALVSMTGTPTSTAVNNASASFYADVTQPPGSLPGNRTDFVATAGTPYAAVYDATHNLIFASNPDWNRVDVISNSTHKIVKSVPIRSPRGIDITQDAGHVWVQTASPHMYEIDTTTFQTRHYTLPSGPVNSAGEPISPAFSSSDRVLAMSDGTLFLYLSGQAGVWNPQTNNVTVLASGISNGFGVPMRSGEGNRVYASRSDLSGGVSLYTVGSQTLPTIGSGKTYWGVAGANRDGSRVVMQEAFGALTLHDSNLGLIGTLPGSLSSWTLSGGSVFSADSTKLYDVATYNNLAAILTIDSSNLTISGIAPSSFSNFASGSGNNVSPTPAAFSVDSTGMVLAIQTYGISFEDSTFYQTYAANQPNSSGSSAPPTPASGPLAGGTTSSLYAFPALQPDVWFGQTRGSTSLSQGQLKFTSPPTQTPGPVNVKFIYPNGEQAFYPQLFGYSTFPEYALTSGASPNGGATGQVVGYGLPQDPSEGTVTVGGNAATITTIKGQYPPLSGEPYPSTILNFTMPAGVPGLADLQVSSANGTGSLPQAILYAKSVNDYSSSDTFAAVIYDAKRKQVYLSAGDHVDVFSLASNQFVTPLHPAANGSKKQFAGLALTPDGSQLLAADLLDGSLAVINPDSPSATFAIHVVAAVAGVNNCEVGPLYVAATSTNVTFVVTGSLPAPSCPQYGDVYAVNLTAHTSAVNTPCYQGQSADASSDGNFVAIGGYSCVYSVASSSFLLNSSLPLTANGVGVAMSGDGNVIGLKEVFTDSSLSMLGAFARPIALYGNNQDWGGPTGLFLYPRLNAAGSLFFLAFADHFEIIDVAHAMLRMRFALSEAIQYTIMPLAIDSGGRNIFLITDKGLTVVDLGAALLSIGHLSQQSAGPGTQVTVRGSGFDSTVTAKVGGVAANVNVTDENTLTLTIPTANSGPEDIVLSRGDGATYTLENAVALP
jgi:hypothetical protein